MYLKRIELQGFKSFPEKIRLEFNRGITAVVGPNGSGKSNIADAVRWVLGEQSAKSLRGSKMEDVIFAGTANRRQLGFAEVVLVIDNTDARLPIGFSELCITRRVYRSGESEYQINGTTCRLKDILEMFMDTGIGKEGYSIIGQGRIEDILSTRSEDRRLLFEEAAGIVKYKNRKHEAENKLERERLNILRLSDIIAELALQVDPLREQSEVAKTYLSLKERLKLLQVNIFLLEADKSSDELKTLEDSLRALAEQIACETALHDAAIENISDVKQKHEVLAAQIRQQEERGGEARVAAESCEGEIRLIEEQIRTITADLERLDGEAADETAKLAALTESAVNTRARQAETEQAYAQAEANLLEKQTAFEEVNRRMSEAEQRIGQFNAQIISRMQAIADTRADEQKAKAAYERLQEIKEELNDDRARVRSQAKENATRLRMLEGSLAVLAETAAKTEAGVSALSQERAECGAALDAASEKLKGLQKQYNESRSRHKLLAELESGYEGYQRSVKSVLLRKGSAGFEGICGSVAELLDVDAKYETAIDIALGAAAQNIITRTENDAVKAIEYLKANREGRATFQPLTTIKGKDMGHERAKLLAEPGVCGIAKELIRYDAAYETVFASLLGKVLVMDGIQNAVRLAGKYHHTYKIVTLEGELLNPGGSMSGGSSHKAVSLFGRSREIKELTRRIASLQTEVGNTEARVASLNRQSTAIKAQIEEKRGLLQQTALEQATLTQSAAQAREMLETHAREEGAFAAKDAELMTRIQTANLEIRGHEATIAENEREVASLHEQRDLFSANMLNEKEEQEEGIRVLMEAKAGLSALEQNRNALSENLARIEQETARVQAEIDKREMHRVERTERRTAGEEKLHGARQKADEIRQSIAALDAEVAVLRGSLAEKSNELAVLEQAERDQIMTLSNLNAENIRLEMKKEQTTENIRRIYDEMWDEYAITYRTALEYERLQLGQAQLTRHERDIKSQIQALGDVNVGAIEEYRHVKERHAFLTAQRADVQSAEAKLIDIIGELTGLMEQQFLEQFQIISENFAYVFREMFGGGTAYLKLQDEANVLETGIDIIAQPPGKKLQSMSLLSGGERALTATALLFGILRMKPSPFCILDEVEAALDDSNVIRYANYLKNFSDDTQFILITHRKGTMEAADVLYGVTMQEQGVSKLVSVKLTE